MVGESTGQVLGGNNASGRPRRRLDQSVWSAMQLSSRLTSAFMEVVVYFPIHQPHHPHRLPSLPRDGMVERAHQLKDALRVRQGLIGLAGASSVGPTGTAGPASKEDSGILPEMAFWETLFRASSLSQRSHWSHSLAMVTAPRLATFPS